MKKTVDFLLILVYNIWASKNIIGKITIMDEIINLQLNVYASDGEIPKYWDPEKKYLYKARSLAGGYGIECEWLSSRIAQELGVDTVLYDIVTKKVLLNNRVKTEKLTVCKTFLDSRFIILDNPAKIYKAGTMEKFLLNYFSSDLQQFNNILILDYIIVNRDRHLNNLGYIIDSDENKKIAPSYDYDKTLYSHITDDNYEFFKRDDPYVFGRPFGNRLANNITFVKNNGCGITLDLSVSDNKLKEIIFSTPCAWSEIRKTNIAEMIVRRYNYVKDCFK